MKTTSLSVRVDDDDAAFLADLQIGDARTPSEKLRALLHSERRRQEGAKDALEAADLFSDLLQPTKRRIRQLEADAGLKSEFLRKFYDRLPEIAGEALVGPGRGREDLAEGLKEFERTIVDDAFNFVQDVLELGFLPQNRFYDTGRIEERLATILDFVELVRLSREREKGAG